MLRRSLSIACLLLAACDAGTPPGTTTSAAVAEPKPPAPTAAPPPSAEPTASASAAPSASAPSAASAVPSASAKATASASARPSASAASTPAPDAGAPDGGAAAPGSALAFAQQLDAIFAGKKTFSAKFVQTATLITGGDPQKSSGMVFIERPGKLSFRYDPPKKDRLVSDGTTMRIYMADNNQMVEMPATKVAYPDAFGFVLGKGIAGAFNFAVNARAKWTEGPVLEGRPRAADAGYEAVLFFLNSGLLDKGDPNALRAVMVIDVQKNRNKFDFSEVTQPPSIPPAEFTFTPPPGTEIKRP